MNYRIQKVLFIFLWFLVSSPSYAVVAGGIISVQHTWPAHSEFNQLTFFQQVSNDGGVNSHYYWANQFFFKKGKVDILVYKIVEVIISLIILSGMLLVGRVNSAISSIMKVLECNVVSKCHGRRGISTN
nr:hypothetical protein [Bartonella senegalensis]